MNKEDFGQERLIEALTLDRLLEDAKSPPVGGYTELPHWHGYTWQPPKASGKFDIVYRNKDGKYHRLFGPAYVSEIYDVEIWFKDGEFHRIDGPAIRHKETFLYYRDGLLHRLDGPAIISRGGPKQFWIEGRKYSPKEYKKEISRRKRKGKL